MSVKPPASAGSGEVQSGLMGAGNRPPSAAGSDFTVNNQPAGRTRSLRYWILKIHLYGSLLCSAYLILFGVTSLRFNHPSAPPDAPAPAITWERTISPPTHADDLIAAETARDALGLMGWPLPWTMNRNPAGDLRFDLERPGKSYTIRVRAQDGSAQVEERRKGFLAVVNSLHAMMEVPNSRFARLWGYYTELCTWVVVFAVFSGVYLWATSKRERFAGALTVGAALLASVSFILYVVCRG